MSVGDVLFLTVVEMGGGTVSVNTGRAFFSGGVVIGEELEPTGTHLCQQENIHLTLKVNNFPVVLHKKETI